MVLEHPPVISYSPAEQLQPFLDGLRGLGIQDPLAVAVRRPSLLGLSLRDNVQVSLASSHRMQPFPTLHTPCETADGNCMHYDRHISAHTADTQNLIVVCAANR